MARTVQLAARVNIGPVTNQALPAIAIAGSERQWIARLDPDQAYPTVQWAVDLHYSTDDGATYRPWRSTAQTGIALSEKGLYPSIGGTFPDEVQPTHLKGFVSLSERIRCGLVAVTP